LVYAAVECRCPPLAASLAVQLAVYKGICEGNQMTDGQVLTRKQKTCPFCKKQRKRITDRDRDVVQLECPAGHKWTVLCKSR
jgi:hypothetical protein